MLQALVCIESVATMGLFVCHCWAYTLRYEHDTIVAHEMPFDGKTEAFCFKKMRRVSNFFSPHLLSQSIPAGGDVNRNAY